jgi:signal transduction histidine kinase/CheY-like chemotaxis protein
VSHGEIAPSADWRPLVFARTCRLLAILSAPAALVGVLMPSPFGLVERATILGFALVVLLLAWLSRNPRHTQPLAALFVGIILLVTLVLSARTGLSPADALGLASAVVLAAVFFGARALWILLALTTLAILALGIGNWAGVLHPTDPAMMFDWRHLSTWSRMAVGFVTAVSVPASAVATMIERLEASVRERDRLLAAERSAVVERAMLLEAAREAAATAQAANKLKDDFMSTVSHELRTPLTAITGWARILRSGSARLDRLDHALEVIERNACAQEKLIADLLDVSRITAGRVRLSVARVEPAAFVRMAIDSVRPAAETRRIRIAATLGDVRPVRGDVGRLQQVVSNLLTNAIKFSPDGGEIEVAVGHAPPDDVTIAVRDHGQGIRADFLPHLFEPFRQGEGGIARSHGGLGLGLTISKKLVELHGGTIDAHSDGEGRGATFVVRLPSASRREPDSEPPLSSRERPVARELGGVRVLLVEDEPDTREMLLSLFDSCGARACGTWSAAAALEQFRRQPPDILVSDLGLRGDDGLSLIRKLRQLPGGGSIPAVALTAFVRDEDRDAALAAGFDAHVCKPLEPDGFLRDVRRLLQDKPSRVVEASAAR